jgi:hypothetical protein
LVNKNVSIRKNKHNKHVHEILTSKDKTKWCIFVNCDKNAWDIFLEYQLSPKEFSAKLKENNKTNKNKTEFKNSRVFK